MNKVTLALGVGLAAVAVAGTTLLMSDDGASEQPPNVIIVLWDTVRADRLSMYGYDTDTTPRMKQWADQQAVVFEHAVSPGMWTVPSHASMFTGLPATTHGAGYDHRHLDDKNVTLAEWFSEHGYTTYAFSANPNLDPESRNLLQGFKHVDLSWGKRWKKKVVEHTKRKLLRPDRSTEISPSAKNKQKGTGYYNAGTVTHEAFLNFVEKNQKSDKPFFAYLSYMEAHKPRVPSLEARQRVADRETIKVGLQTDVSFDNQLLYSYGKHDYSQEQLQAINSVYDATLTELDDVTADLFDDLETRGLLENTIIVFTSDHGEQLGNHQLFGHRNGVYHELLHVPLIVSYPAELEAGRVSTPVTNLDIFNTLIELTGVPAPDGGYARGNLVDAARRDATGVYAESRSFDRLGFNRVRKKHPDLERDVWANRYRTVVDGAWKLIETVDFDTGEVAGHELFHLAEDPLEAHDVAADHPDQAAALAKKLADWQENTPAWKPEDGDVVDTEMTDEMKRQLKILGYIEGDEDEGAASETEKKAGKAGKRKAGKAKAADK